MHYLHPFTVNQVDNLRYQAMNIVAVRLGRAEPPLRKEVAEYMLDVDSHMWSMRRRSKANFFLIISLLSGLFSVSRWFSDVPPKTPTYMDTKLSWAEAVNPDELDEEINTFPTLKPHDIVQLRYDRLRSVAGRIQTVVGIIENKTSFRYPIT
ncbi:hypothetical protein EZV62_023935 [Acer yangbiense]|uniref:Multiple C2 domain-containing protein n=1 Tax=Acer yangbiense TaxID=1000413 RepID=A0A5C7H3C1_9ROSI|nr:hypothetical protein EZV62_023935 [Acer yangbiense]